MCQRTVIQLQNKDIKFNDRFEGYAASLQFFKNFLADQ